MSGGGPMPQIKQQKKRVLTNNKAHVRNVAQKSALKTAIKKVVVAVEAGDKEAAVATLSQANKKLDAAVSKGFKHKNYAANQKSRLAKAVNSIQ